MANRKCLCCFSQNEQKETFGDIPHVKKLKKDILWPLRINQSQTSLVILIWKDRKKQFQIKSKTCDLLGQLCPDMSDSGKLSYLRQNGATTDFSSNGKNSTMPFLGTNAELKIFLECCTAIKLST